jgi:S1-C subfamily serine protease
MMSRFFTFVLVVLMLAAGSSQAGNDRYARSIVRVHTTAQSWDFQHPWQKGKTVHSSSFGVVLNQNRILVLGTAVANAVFIEVEIPGSGAKARAQVATVDYLANLALLKCDNDEFLADMKPVSILRQLDEDDSCDVVQLQKNDELEVYEGRLSTTEVSRYPTGGGKFLIHRIKVDLGGTFTNGMAPLFRRGKLAGILMAYGEAQKIGIAIPPPVIHHFLDDVEDGSYAGFPEMGFEFVSLLDPALRRFVGMKNGEDGLFIAQVVPGTAADNAGLQVGDVLTGIDQVNVDKRGEYQDPDYGRIHIAHLIKCRHSAGDQVELHIVRGGQRLILPATLMAAAPDKWPVPPFSIDEPPSFIVVGGLVMQELTAPFFAPWGNDWNSKAPRHLSRLVRRQWDLAKPGQRFVVLSSILPSSFTTGYEPVHLKQLVNVNGIPIHSLKDVARALETPLAGFHHFEFADDYPGEIVLAATVLPQVDAEIRQSYRLPLLRRF